MPGPLEGVRIVDCSAYITGPFATMILADQGADVIKVEPTGTGDVMRYLGTARGGISTVFAGCNRSKRSLALDLREAAGREILYKLVEWADVFVQNFRPGVVERIEIDEARLRRVRPDLIYVSVSAFGPDGPWSNKPAFDHVVQALSGVASVQADIQTEEPRFVQNAMVDKLTALTASQAITAALLHRERSGEGQHVQLSMLDAALHFLWPDGMGRDTLLGEGVELRPPIANGYRMIELADGHAAVAAITQEQIHGIMRAVGRPEFIEDERFSTVNALLANLDEFTAETRAASLTMTVEEFVAAFEREDVPCSPVLTTNQVADHPQVKNNGIVEEVEHPVMGRMRRPRPPARFSESPSEVSRHAPTLGEHRDELLRQLGLSEAEQAELVAKGIVG
ncbi:MAG: CoA transferase [Deltaproteobacteria bacterium]|nr:CoA transferase [Deltaproteobacteria bacterium]MBW2398181.1 CoA transferase [Deltaproteobacteria bacterium]